MKNQAKDQEKNGSGKDLLSADPEQGLLLNI